MMLPPLARVLLVTTITVVIATSFGSLAAAALPADVPGALSSVPSSSSSSEDREGSQFYSGSTIDVAGDIDGDVYAAGQNVTVSGHVTGDVIAAAQFISVTGVVDGDVRLAGQAVTISGEVSRSGTIFASDVALTSAGSFGDDLVGAAGTFVISGEVGRDMQVSVGALTIDGVVGGSVTYISDTDARIADGSVAGSVEHVVTQNPRDREVSPWTVLGGWLLGLLYALVALSLVTVLAALLVPRWLHMVTDHLVPSPWRALLVGFVAFVTVPVGLVAILVTVVGAPLAVVGALFWLVLTLATFVHGAYFVGRLVLRRTHRPVLLAFVGGLILIAALQVPWLNVVVWFAMVFFGLGAQLLELRRLRPWHMDPVGVERREGE